MPKWLNSFWPRGEKLAHGYTDAKYALVFTACLGELLQGGLMFGWNALALMLTARGTYSDRCNEVGQREALDPGPLHNQIPDPCSDVLVQAFLLHVYISILSLCTFLLTFHSHVEGCFALRSQNTGLATPVKFELSVYFSICLLHSQQPRTFAKYLLSNTSK